jgi:AbrB family looped-hinge helix DNA binding protein
MKKSQGKFAWTAKVGEKGQIVIPKEARDIFNIQPGDTLLLLGDEEQGIAIVRKEMFNDILNAIMNPQNPNDD